MMRLEALAFRRIIILGPACSCLLRKVKMQDFRPHGFNIGTVVKFRHYESIGRLSR